MNTDIRDNDNIEIKRITINGMNIKDILNEEFVAKLDENLANI
ncbi:hypothetical protein [Methanobrevibacter sp.]